jgi:hypothetical protein
METKKESLASAFGLENESELFAHCMELSTSTTSCSDILNKLICSDLNTKEMMYCAFICGKMQEMDKEMAALLFVRKRLMEILEEKI